MVNHQKPLFFILGLILLTGFLLRFWDFWSIPFTFDELSAMGRTTYYNFQDLIRFGVVERDSHPAGIQVFLYYWTSLFGESEMIVKLPFLLAGMASIWLSFRIGNLWFGKTTGILTAAYVSSLQLFVMYSQIARPYSSGLFFTLVMVWYWSKYFLVSDKTRYLMWFVLFASLSAYNHYFSLLFAAMVGMTGFFFVRRNTIWPYMLSGVAIFVLYIPHLPIFLAQAEKGSIGGWLGMPSIWFPLQFLDWLFHYSFWVYSLLILIVIIGLISGKKKPVSEKNKKRVILFLWLLPAPVFGYLYSLKVEPILQYSLIIFSAPYLFILLFSFVGKIEYKKLGILVIVILFLNIMSLVSVRKHYQVFYKQPFEQVVKDAIQLDKQHPGDVVIINDYIPYYSEYYFRKNDKTLPYFTVRNRNIDFAGFDSVVSHIQENTVVTSSINPSYFQIVNKHFPAWVAYDYGFTFEQYTFSKVAATGSLTLKTEPVAFTDFSNVVGDWKFSKNFLIDDSLSHSRYYQMNPNQQWGPACSFSLDTISENRYLFLDLAVEVKPADSFCRGVLVAQIKKGEELVAWYGMNFEKYEPVKEKWQEVYLTINISDALKDEEIAGCTFETFIWNPKENNFQLRTYKISARPGNPYRYALFYDFDD